MVVYIIMILTSISFLIIAERVKKKPIKIAMYILAVVPFFLVSAFRYNLGTDYAKRYVTAFNQTLKGQNISNLEIGFKLLIQVCIWISKTPDILFIVTSGIIISLIMYTIYSKSSNKILSVIIFFLGGFFFASLNLVRQYIAISIILFGYRFLIKENRKYYLAYIACVLLAMSMHSTSIVALILVVLSEKNLVSWKWIIPCSILVLVLGENLMQLVSFVIENTRFKTYLTGKWANGEISKIWIFENLIVYIFMYYIYIKNKKLNKCNKEDTLFLNIQGLSLLVTCFGACHRQFLRIVLYFLIFQILSIPHFISKMPVNEIKEDIIKLSKNKIKSTKIFEHLQQIVSAIFIILLLRIFYSSNIQHNDNEVVPYKTVLNKEIKIK